MEQIDDRHRITVLYNMFWRELYIVAFRRLKNEENTEDILQDIFLSLMERDVNLDNEPSVRALLHKRLKSRIIDFFRKELIISMYQDYSLQADSEVSYSDTELMNRELEAVVQLEVENLPVKMKEIFLLSREEHLSTEEIANRLSISEKTVRNQLSTALKRIKTTIKRYNAFELNASTVNLVVTVSAAILGNR